ncbi:MAG TPA: TIGR02452 family protein, partial [Thermoanaerobaculia bacterium]|nr:TIGR02452 family protein [Thermoanaerobaculia bacterium]
LERVLAIAASKPCDALILGAWGCGVFRNKPADVVELFHKALGPRGAFRERFPLVVYAVYDQSPTQATRETFRRLALP